MEKVLIFGHKNPDTDSILSSLVLEGLEKTLGVYDVKAYRLGEINKETRFALNYFGVKEPELLEKVEAGQEVMLVDHNAFEQSVEGIENAKIVRVVDHHNLAQSFSTPGPLFYLAMPVGCTGTILSEMFKVSGIKMDRTTAGLMLSAIISDTLLLKSPTCTDKDREVANELAQIADIDINSYGLELLKAGTDLSDVSPEKIINIDSKAYSVNGIKYQAAQVNTASINEVLKNKNAIEEAMNNFMNQNNVDLFVLMITDIIENNSQLIAMGRMEIAEKAFNVKFDNNMAFLPGVVSRKKQIVPNIDNAILGK